MIHFIRDSVFEVICSYDELKAGDIVRYIRSIYSRYDGATRIEFKSIKTEELLHVNFTDDQEPFPWEDYLKPLQITKTHH